MYVLGLISWPARKGAKLTLIKGGGGGGDILGNYKKTRTVSFVGNFISVLEVKERFPIQTLIIVDRRVGLLCLKA